MIRMNLAELAEGMSNTRLLYLDDSYLKESSCNILRVEPDDRKSAYVLLDQTIFHPKSGGQPSDRGRILGDGFAFDVKKVMMTGEVIIHWGKNIQGTPQSGASRLEIDWESRYRYMRKHTAAHLFDGCLSAVLKERVETTDSWVGDDSYIGYRGACPATEQLQSAKTMENELIGKGANVTSQMMTREEALLSSPGAPNLDRLPENKHLRVVTIEGFHGIPCGGTHLKNIKEIGQFKLKSPEVINGGFRVNFDVIP